MSIFHWIGSFPQTQEVGQARLKWRKGEWSGEQYEAFSKEQIATWIRLQEKIGMDVLVRQTADHLRRCRIHPADDRRRNRICPIPDKKR